MSNKILKNAIRCHKCGDIIESTNRHDFKWCSCGSVAVDGGHDYLRRCAKENATWDDLSESIPYEDDEDKEETKSIKVTNKDREDFIKSLSHEEIELLNSLNGQFKKRYKSYNGGE